MTSVLALNWGDKLEYEFLQTPKLWSPLFFLQISTILFNLRSSSRMAKGKFVAVTDEPRGRGASDDKGKCPFGAQGRRWILTQSDALDYLAMNGIKLPDEIIVKWCPLKTDMMVPPHDEVFVHP